MKQELKDFIIHNPLLYTDKENLKWCWLRAVEWGEWPMFMAQLIAPILFLLFAWWYVTIVVVILDWLWTLIRYRYISVTLVGLGPIVTLLKWPVSIGMGIYFLVNGNYLLGVVCALWPVITLILMFLTPPTKIGMIQTALMNKLGYEKII